MDYRLLTFLISALIFCILGIVFIIIINLRKKFIVYKIDTYGLMYGKIGIGANEYTLYGRASIFIAVNNVKMFSRRRFEGCKEATLSGGSVGREVAVYEAMGTDVPVCSERLRKVLGTIPDVIYYK